MRLYGFVRSGLALVVLTALAAPVAAQNSVCATYSGDTQRLCDAAVDGTRAFHPVAGLLVSGGNPVLGVPGASGGLGHLSLTARVNAVKVQLPDLNYDGSGASVPAGEDLVAPAPLIEASVGIYRGLSGGLLAVDVLGSAQLLPTDQIDNLRVDPDARRIGSVALGLGYGLRVGVLRGSFPIPAISVSLMRRNIPEIKYGDLADGDQYTYAVDLKATNLRATAGWGFGPLHVSGGLGWDKYTGSAMIEFTDPLAPLPTVEQVAFDLSNSRVMGFLNAEVGLSVVNLGAELGYQLGKDQNLTTQFDEIDTTAGKLFAGVGIRIGI